MGVFYTYINNLYLHATGIFIIIIKNSDPHVNLCTYSLNLMEFGFTISNLVVLQQ